MHASASSTIVAPTASPETSMSKTVPENRKQQPRLDPRDPLVLDTRELGRRPGSMHTVQLSAPAPGGLGLEDLIAVPVGAELELDLRLESVMDGVLVTGTVTPSARQAPRTKVVLPAPSSPDTVTTSPGSSRPARRGRR